MNDLLKKCSDLNKIRQKPTLLLLLDEINNDCVFELYDLLNGNSFPELDVIIHTPGGSIEAAFQITKLIRKVAKKVNIIVPYYAKSAGTLICFGADKIYLSLLSELGPLDTQILEAQDSGRRYTSALNGFKALEQVQLHTLESLDIATKLILARSGMKISEAIHLANEFSGQTSGTLYSQLDPKKIGEYARALDVGERYGILILTRFMGWSDKKASQTVKHFVKNYPSHGFIIDIEELTDLGFPVCETGEVELPIIDDIRKSMRNLKNNVIKFIPYVIKETSGETKRKQ